ncbi:SOS response-associated peptidase [Thalassobacillus sp. CUG 92003]|uniref:SOS response-associated peptidase n=1 Tax=Thalassobacillus sp. CUG 92003 TaxID=2736641 RepID=UPI0015E76CD4|nr:SOS response-associated peptidase [Thalassobacillus sp. CUG 92003]
MCGRYTLLAEEAEILEAFGLSYLSDDYQPRYNIAPGQKVLAIIHDGRDKRAGYLHWGLVPSWAKDPKIGYKMINARSETAHEKPSFKQLMARKRCLIVADSFYEWQKTESGKQPKRIFPHNRKLFAFAGLWDKWQQDEEERFTCTILTKEANSYMAPIHDRMPVILPEEKQDQWIENIKWEPGQAHDFLQSLPSQALDSYDISDYVNSPKNEGPACIESLTS